MADLKISELTTGAPAQTADEFPINRAGANFKLLVGDVTALVPAQTAFVFSNSNGVSFGTAGSTVTATVQTNYLTSQSNQNVTAANGGFAFQTLSFSNTQGVSFATSAGSAIVGSVAAGATATGNLGAIAVNALTTYTSGTVVFSNSNGITFGTNAQTITVSYTVPGSTVFSNSNNVSFGLAGSTVTATATFAQSNQQMTMFATGNTTQSSTGTTNASSLIFRAAGIASIGITGGSVVVSVPAGAPSPVNFSAGTTSGDLGSVVFSNSNNVVFGLNGSTITASASSSLTAINLTAGTTNSSASAFNFSNSVTLGGVVFGMNAVTITASISRVTYSSTVIGMGLGGMSSATFGQNTFFVFPHILEDYITCAVVKIPVAITNSSSAAASVQNGWTVNFAIYTRNATNSTVLTRHYSTTYTMAASHSSNASWRLSLITAVGNSTSYSTLTASSAGLGLSASLHGVREIIMPVSSLFTPGEYWFGMGNSTSSAGAVGNVLRLSNIVLVGNSGNRVGVSMGNNDGIYRNAGWGSYSVTTASPPAGISFTQLNNLAINAFPVFMFSATV